MLSYFSGAAAKTSTDSVPSEQISCSDLTDPQIIDTLLRFQPGIDPKLINFDNFATMASFEDQIMREYDCSMSWSDETFRPRILKLAKIAKAKGLSGATAKSCSLLTDVQLIDAI